MSITMSNVTSASEITVTDPYFIIFGSVMAPIISVIVVILIGYFTIRFNQKQYNKNALIDVFETFNSLHKSREEIIFNAYRENYLYKANELTAVAIEPAKHIMRNYDQIGLLFNRSLIPKEDYFFMYGRLTVVIHFVLFLHIDKERKLGRKHYVTFFTKLAIQCYDYWKENYIRNKVRLQYLSRSVVSECIGSEGL